MSRLERYLARLPNGVDSYPDVVVKASTFTAAFAEKPVPVAPGSVPAALERLIVEPPPVTAWVPEVQMVAIFKMIGDHHFEGRGGTPAFLAWVYEQNRRLLSGKLYRALFWFLTPDAVLRGVQHRWSAFRRGTDLALIERTPGRALFEMRYRENLLDNEGLLAIGTALRAAADAAGAKGNEVTLVDASSTRGHLRLSWVE